MILALRSQDPIPDWITHLAVVHQGKVASGKKEEILASDAAMQTIRDQADEQKPSVIKRKEGRVLVDMKNVKVSYGERKVCIMLNKICNRNVLMAHPGRF
jgi:hypothetical protein